MFRKKAPEPRRAHRPPPAPPEPHIKVEHAVFDPEISEHSLWLTYAVPLSNARKLRDEIALSIAQAEAKLTDGRAEQVGVTVQHRVYDPSINMLSISLKIVLRLSEAKDLLDTLDLRILRAEAQQ